MKIETYNELNQYFNAFCTGKLPFLLIQSRGGVGKSYHASYLLDDDNTLFFQGHITPYSLFKTVQANSKQTLVFDDVDTLLDTKDNVALLKQICDTTEEKRVTWHTTRGGENVTESFYSHNDVLVLANNLNISNANEKALKTRGIYVEFNPTNDEVMLQLSQFLNDNDVIEYIQNMDIQPKTLNFRHGIKAKQTKKAGLDWKKYLQTEINQAKPDYTEIAKECKRQTDTAKQAVARWKDETGMSMKSYYNYLP